jgi:hypothetical protein
MRGNIWKIGFCATLRGAPVRVTRRVAIPPATTAQSFSRDPTADKFIHAALATRPT